MMTWREVKEKVVKYRQETCLVCLCFILITLSTYTFLALPAQRVVTYDASHSIHLLSTQAARAHLSAPQIKALSARFSRVLKETLMLYANEQHVVIVKPEMVLVDNEDITATIEKILSVKMRPTLTRC